MGNLVPFEILYYKWQIPARIGWHTNENLLTHLRESQLIFWPQTSSESAVTRTQYLSLSLITGLGLLQANPISNQALFWSFWSCKILSLDSRPSKKASASVSALSGKLVLHLIGNGQSPVCVSMNHCCREKGTEESKQMIGSDTLEPSAPRGERGSHRTHTGYCFSIRMKDAVLQIPDVLPGPLLSFLSSLPTPRPWHFITPWQRELVQRKPKSASKEKWQDHLPQATTSRCMEGEKGGSSPKASSA